MKILHVSTGLSTGGAERALYNLLAGGLANRSDAAVVSLRDEGTIGPLVAALGIPVYSMNMASFISGARVIAGLRRIVRSFEPDLIQGWMYHGNLAASAAAWMNQNRTAVAWNIRQCLYDMKVEKPLTRQVIRANRCLSRQADAVIYNSCLAKAQHESFGLAADRSQVISNGFDLERFRPDPETRMAVRREFNTPKDALVIGHVARFHPMKDHASFLRAAVTVARQVSNIHFLLAGREVSLQNPTLANIVPLELMERFIFTGERMDVHRLMQAMDIFCLSSWSEAFPNVLGEAMACGAPCVATDVGDCRDIVGGTGILVPPSDSVALAEGLLAMSMMSTADRAALGLAARMRIEERYAIQAVVEQYVELYQKMTE
ncbi:Glycosyltransferase involved in cell wall bisynthesis [Desulfomicrobium norvegicum]|uniref:Glycosyltransferase involved in cell wall bisynthesis n=1 Tax=Desulfomicrobium norvegicum (strain DSM 1741 / NCIMB 8310) TaxID=52561 RepID=A0A8G2C1T3_DESNO|nr:glycosyltransferase [Desulfomicrobium norvegicum]SFL46675.1 Glycosyltransferase involved in cell wall bisynthesis [Desulfomicrobium norvegicum]